MLMRIPRQRWRYHRQQGSVKAQLLLAYSLQQKNINQDQKINTQKTIAKLPRNYVVEFDEFRKIKLKLLTVALNFNMQAYFLDATASDKNKNEAFLWIQFAWNKHEFKIKQINLVWKDKYRHHGSPLPSLYAFRIVTNSPRASTGKCPARYRRQIY